MNHPMRHFAAIAMAVFLCLSIIPTALASEQIDDNELLSRLVWLEARGESDEGQQAVVFVIVHRLRSGQWGNTLRDVLYASGQFTPAKSIPSTTPTEKEYRNVAIALAALESDAAFLPPWVMYFAVGGHSWRGYTSHMTIGNHKFGGFTAEKNAYEQPLLEVVQEGTEIAVSLESDYTTIESEGILW